MQGQNTVFGPRGRAFAISCVRRFDPLENAGTFFEATYLTATAATAFRFGELPPDSSIQVCLPEISKYLTGRELYFLHNSSRCSFFSRHSSHLWPRSSGRVLPSGSRTWLYAIKSACSRGLQESAQN